MQQPADTCVSQQKIDADGWPELAESLMKSAAWSEDATVFVYTESLDDCTLAACRSTEVLDKVNKLTRSEPSQLLEGRIFNQQAEARWRRLQNGTWTAIIIREHQSAQESGKEVIPARRIVRRYYLLGARGSDPSKFHEARYAKRFQYPVRDACHDDRVYIEVAEYWYAEPDWCKLTDGEMLHVLERPLLFAHRFVDCRRRH